MNHKSNLDLQEALRQIDYLNMIIVSAAAAPERLPYWQSNRDDDLRNFHNHMGSLVCLLQAHLADLSEALRSDEMCLGQFADFRPLIADTIARLESGAPIQETLHQHVRNLFAFDGLVSADQPCALGVYIRNGDNDCGQAVCWLMDVLSGIECGLKLNDILGDAQNTIICTRLCFGDAVDALELWQRDLQLILPGTTSIT